MAKQVAIADFEQLKAEVEEMQSTIKLWADTSVMPSPLGNSNAPGLSEFFARADHRHEAKEQVEHLLAAEIDDITITGDLTFSGTPTFSANIIMADDTWIGLGASPAGRIEFDDQATDEINFLNCNVGIGTNTPAKLLDVAGHMVVDRIYNGIDDTGNIDFTAGDVWINSQNLIVNTGAFSTRQGATFNVNAGDYDFLVKGDTDVALLFCNAGTDRVGIGTTSPGEKLEVNGNILLGGTNKVVFRDAQIYIASLSDGHLDLAADTSIDMNANVVFTGDAAVQGTHQISFYDAGIHIASLTDGHLDLTADIVVNINDSAHIQDHLYINAGRDTTLLTGNLRIESDSESEPTVDTLYDVSANSFGRTRRYQATGSTSTATTIALWTYTPASDDPSIQCIVIRATVVWVNTDSDSIGMKEILGHFKKIGSTGAGSEINPEHVIWRSIGGSGSPDSEYQVLFDLDFSSNPRITAQSLDGDDCVWYANIEVTEIVFKAEGGGGGC